MSGVGRLAARGRPAAGVFAVAVVVMGSVLLLARSASDGPRRRTLSAASAWTLGEPSGRPGASGASSASPSEVRRLLGMQRELEALVRQVAQAEAVMAELSASSQELDRAGDRVGRDAVAARYGERLRERDAFAARYVELAARYNAEMEGLRGR